MYNFAPVEQRVLQVLSFLYAVSKPVRVFLIDIIDNIK